MSHYRIRSQVVTKIAQKAADIVKKVPANMSRAPRSVVVQSSGAIKILRPEHPEKCIMLPVTWGISTFQHVSTQPDERFCESNEVFLTGVKVQFNICYINFFRLRMVCYTPSSAGGVASFTSVTSTGISSLPVTMFKPTFMLSTDTSIMPGGSFAKTLVDRQRADGGGYVFDSSDGNIYNVRLSSSLSRKEKFELTKNTNNDEVTQVEDISCYVPIGEKIVYENERSSFALSGNFQILIFGGLLLLSPSLYLGTKQERQAIISAPRVKIYYRYYIGGTEGDLPGVGGGSLRAKRCQPIFFFFFFFFFG